jgi:hypothetical protein
VMGGGQYGSILGDAIGVGINALAAYAPGGQAYANVMIQNGNGFAGYPANNFYPSTNGNVGFTSAASGDFSLTASSLYHAAGTDGLDPGANMAALNAATANVIVP